METEKQFPRGIIFKLPSEKAPDFIKGKLSVKVDEAVQWLQAHVNNNGWVDLDLKIAKNGKPYCELNTYKPQKPDLVHEELDTSIPF